MAEQTSSAVALIDRLVATPIEQRSSVLASVGDSRTTLVDLIEHASRMTLADAARADLATDMLVNLADRVGSALDRARARRTRARALSYLGRFREALSACAEGVRLADEGGSAIESGRARLASMHALGELGRLDEAIEAGESAREAFLRAGESALAARADLNIGTVHQRGDEPGIALECFDRARPLLLEEPVILGPLDNNRGEALVALHDFVGARQAFEQALTTLRETESWGAAAIVESNLADLDARQGNLPDALLHFEQARRFLERGGSPTHLARLLAEQAEAMSTLGMPQQALCEFERALHELDRLGMTLESARARTGMGRTLLILGRRSQAETALAAAATAFAELGHATARARIDLLRAEVAAANGRHNDARSMALRAMAALDDRPADMAAAHLLLGRLAVGEGRDQDAHAQFALSRSLAEQLDLPPLLADVLHQRGRLLRRRGEYAAALADLTHAVRQIERVRGSLQADRVRAAFLGSQAAVYEELAATHLDRGEPADADAAFKVIERAKARVLNDLMRRQMALKDAASAEGSDEAHLLQQLHAAQADLNALYSVASDNSMRTPSANSAWRKTLREREQQVDDIESRLAATGRASSTRTDSASLSDLQTALPEQTAIVEYFGEGADVSAFVIQRDRIEVRRAIASLADVVKANDQIQFEVHRALTPDPMKGSRGTRLQADAAAALDGLGRLLWLPIESALPDALRVVFVPHAALHVAPLHAMRSRGTSIMQSRRVSYAPSATILGTMLSAHSIFSRSRRSLVVGVADAQAPSMDQEARDVAAMLAGAGMEPTLLVDSDATVAAVSSGAREAGLIHLACHGRHAPDAPLASGLRLHDRWLTARDVRRWRIAGSVVALSGCETGLSQVDSGNELSGLLSSMLAAGAISVVASLWRVDDATTREFMTAFYGSWRTVRSAADLSAALQAAHIKVMQTHPHPAFWAPFVLVGQP